VPGGVIGRWPRNVPEPRVGGSVDLQALGRVIGQGKLDGLPMELDHVALANHLGASSSDDGRQIPRCEGKEAEDY